MKMQEVARKQGDAAKLRTQCHTVCELGKRLDASLGVKHRHLKHPRRRHSRPKKKDRNPQPVIFSMREAVRSAGKLNPSDRQRVVDALQEIMRELAVS